MNQLSKTSISITTVVGLVLWVASVVGTYYATRAENQAAMSDMQGQIANVKSLNQNLQVDIEKLQNHLEKLQGPVLIYRMNEFETKIDDLNEKTDRIYTVVSSWVD